MPKLSRGKLSNRLLHVQPVFHTSYLLIFAVVAVIIGIQYVASHAAGYPAVLTIDFAVDGSVGALNPTNYTMTAVNHDIGICYGVNRAWVWSNGNNVCDGNTIGTAGPTFLIAPSIGGYSFTSWTGNCASVSGNQCQVDVPAYSNQTVIANYHNNSYVPPPTPAPTPTPVPSTPTPTPKPTPKPTAAPASHTPTPTPVIVVGKGGSTATPTPAPPDTTPPTVPTNLVASQSNGSVVVTLQWAASTDTGSGVKGYSVDRSSDNVSWTNLQTSLGDTSYTDTTTQFGVHYYYRVAAVDNAGNSSTYATANLTTGSFQASASSDKGQQLSSDDGILTLSIPAGAVAQDAACSLDAGTSNASTGKLIAGTYALTCKDQTGNDITTFNQSLVWTFVLPTATTKPYGLVEAVTFDQGGRMTVASKLFNRKTHTISFSSSQVLEAGVLGIVTHSIWPVIFQVLFVVMLILGGVYYLGLRRLRKQNYDEYLRRKYNEL